MTTTATVEASAVVPRIRVNTTALTDHVYRVQGGVATLVRGFVEAGVAYDYEAPQEVPVTYQTGPAPGGGAETTGAVEMPDVGVWLIPPGIPDAGALVRVENKGVGDLTMAGGMSVAVIPGRREPIAVTWQRQSLAGSIEGIVLDDAEHDVLLACLDVSGPLFVSSPWRVGPLRDVSWIVVGDVSLEQLDLDGDAYRVKMPFTPVARPVVVTTRSFTIDNLVGTIAGLNGTIDSLGA